MKRSIITAFIAIGVVLLTGSFSFSARLKIKLTDNDYDDCLGDINNNGYVVWYDRCDGGGPHPEIFLYNGIGSVQLTFTPDAYDTHPMINDNNHVIWKKMDDAGTEICLYNGAETIQLTTSAFSKFYPQINNSGHAVWYGNEALEDTEIYYYDGSSIYQLTDNDYYDGEPKINSTSKIVWESNFNDEDTEIFLYEGSLPANQITDNLVHDRQSRINDSGTLIWTMMNPVRDIYVYSGIGWMLSSGHDSCQPDINNHGHAVWMELRYNASEDWDFEIFLYNGTDIVQLTDNAHDDQDPRINDIGHVVWKGFDGNDDEIFFYNGTSIIQLTDNNYDDRSPKINDSDYVVWEGHDDTDYDIFLSKPYTEPEKQWARIFGGMHSESAHSVLPLTDESGPSIGYILAADTRSFGAGGSDAWVLRLDNDGNALWEKTYGGVDDDFAAEIHQTSDGGYIVIGTTQEFDADGDIWLVKLTADGSIAWQKSYGGPEIESASSVQPTSDDGYILAGRTESFGAGTTGDLWIIKTDAAGDVDWQYTYGVAGRYEFAHCVKEVSGGYAVFGTKYVEGAGDSDFWLMKLNTTGSVSWQKAYGGPDFEYGQCFQQTGDGGYVMAGSRYSFDPEIPRDVWVVKVDSAGNIVWQKAYGTGVDATAWSIVQTEDGYVLTGQTCVPGPGSPPESYCDAWVMKLDADGDIVWQKEYGGPNVTTDDLLSCVRQTLDDGYIAVGTTESFGFGDREAWVLKLGADGEIDGCAAMGAWSATAATTSTVSTVTPVDGTATSVTAETTTATASPLSSFTSDGCTYFSNILDLPRTGQTVRYHAKDDGHLRAGVVWPSPRFSDHGNGTIIDNLTGLMWLKDANCARTIGHDPDDTEIGTMDWESALDFIAGINAGTYDISGCAGYTEDHTDWRLPNINELASITNLGEPDQATWLHAQGFEQVESWPVAYWSSTTNVDWDGGAQTISMSNGHFNWDWKVHFDYVWPVRAGQMDLPDPAFPANVMKTGQTISYHAGDDGDLQMGIAWPFPRFSDHGNGTVTDNLTGLMWLKDADCFGALDYETTFSTIAGFNVNPDSHPCLHTAYSASYNDWRLANRIELLSLIDRSQADPPLPAGHPFISINPGMYRSSTTNAYVDYMEWNVDLYYYGSVSYSTRGTKPFMLVRGGQCKAGGAIPSLPGILFLLLGD